MKKATPPRSLPSPTGRLPAPLTRLHDRAYVYLKDLLLNGGLEPGDLISTERVGNALGISRAPATDAMRRLTSEGFVEVLPQIGCRVRTPARSEIGDFFELFARGESFVTRLAAERRSRSAALAFAAECESIEQSLDRLEAEKGSTPAMRELNQRRHRYIHGLAESPIAAEIVASFWDRSDFYIRIAFGTFVIMDAARTAHRTIAQAIIDGDVSVAEQETLAYLRVVGQRVAGNVTPG
jgi:DNA-binding GntR family transcriptional regulator